MLPTLKTGKQSASLTQSSSGRTVGPRCSAVSRSRRAAGRPDSAGSSDRRRAAACPSPSGAASGHRRPPLTLPPHHRLHRGRHRGTPTDTTIRSLLRHFLFQNVLFWSKLHLCRMVCSGPECRGFTHILT